MEVETDPLVIPEVPEEAEKVENEPVEQPETSESLVKDAEFKTVFNVEPPEEEKIPIPENSVSENVERTSESPTTGDNNAWCNTKCVFCNQLVSGSDEPRLLECLHSACGGCIKTKMNETNQEGTDSFGNKIIPCLSCALCQIVSRHNQVIENRFLTELIANEETPEPAKEDLKCNSCSDNDVATSWCVECAEFICNKCVQAHKRLKITKDHTIKSKEEAVQENQNQASISKNLICSTHPNEQLTLFCENCEVLTCRDCQLTEHRDHKYKFTHEIATETKTFISGMLKDVSYKRVLLDSAMKVIDDRQNLITEKKQALVKEITQMVVKLTNTINVRGKELVHRLNEVCDNKQKTLNEKKQALEQLSQLTDHCIDFVQNALDKGSDMAILFAKRHVTNHLQRIKCRRADIPNPEIPVRIHLALDKVPDLIKVLSSIGAIVVDGKVYPSVPSSNPQPPASIPPATSPTQRPQQPPTSPLLMPRMPPPYPQHSQSQHSAPQHHMQSMPGQSQPHQQNHQVPQNHQQQVQQNQYQMSQQGLRPIRPMMGQILHRMPGSSQVSSSTHPQSMGMDRGMAPQLRGLLQHNNGQPVYIKTGPRVYQAVQGNQYSMQQQQHYMQQQQQQSQMQQYPHQNRMPHPHPQQQGAPRPIRLMQQLNQPFHQRPPQPMSAAKWHIPQQDNDPQSAYGNNSRAPPALLAPDESFKITLKPLQEKVTPAAVTSTIPKTPSPSLGKDDSTERNLDKFCEDSVNDLMATIAKLDSNGVQVFKEGRTNNKTGGSPHVDSSTDEANKNKAITTENEKDDPNEDWCAVCMDGGELVCCDKCPKVFHQNCHIPPLSVEESDTWQCLLCMNFADVSDTALGEGREGGLSPRERKIAERLILELYCQYEPSLHFREVVPPEHTYYHSVVKKPISLDVIKKKLDWNAPEHYMSMKEIVMDVRLLFRNAYLYNPEDSPVYKDAKTLEAFFDQQLEKWLPMWAYENPDDEDDDMVPPTKKFKRVITD